MDVSEHWLNSADARCLARLWWHADEKDRCTIGRHILSSQCSFNGLVDEQRGADAEAYIALITWLEHPDDKEAENLAGAAAQRAERTLEQLQTTWFWYLSQPLFKLWLQRTEKN